MLNPCLFTLLTVSVLATFSSILVYPTSYALAQNATDDDSTTTEGIERADDTATIVRRAPDDTTRPSITIPEEDRAPVISIPDDITEEATGPDGAQVTYTVTAEDNIDGPADVEISCDHNSGDTFPIGETVVTCTAEDEPGNQARASFRITVTDTTTPVITGTRNILVEAPTLDRVSLTYAVTAEDNVDGIATLGKNVDHVQDDVGGDIAISCDPASGSLFQVGVTTTVHCSATDAAGNTGRASFIITVFFPDTTPPVITVPSDITEEATGPDGAQVSFEEPTAVDDVDGAVNVDCNRNSNEIFPTDETVITCNAEDEARNPAEESFIITVVDTTPPVITVPSDITEEATGPDGAQVSFRVSAEDIVDGPVDVICNHNPSDRFPVVDTTVLCRSTDTAGNPAEESFIITVVDTPGGGGGEVPEGGGGGEVPEGGGGGEVPEGGTILRPDFLVGGGDGRTILPPGTGWVTPLVVLASVVMGGIALAKYKASRGRSRRLEISPSALVEVRSKGGISR